MHRYSIVIRISHAVRRKTFYNSRIIFSGFYNRTIVVPKLLSVYLKLRVTGIISEITFSVICRIPFNVEQLFWLMSSLKLDIFNSNCIVNCAALLQIAGIIKNHCWVTNVIVLTINFSILPLPLSFCKFMRKPYLATVYIFEIWIHEFLKFYFFCEFFETTHYDYVRNMIPGNWIFFNTFYLKYVETLYILLCKIARSFVLIYFIFIWIYCSFFILISAKIIFDMRNVF